MVNGATCPPVVDTPPLCLALQQRLHLEDLTRRRTSADAERYVETFRRAAVDPNPHQVEAVAFALGRLERGGALLCDEVGLGKTIETGLLLTQLRAEGKSNVLVVAPVPLMRQWQVELLNLFSLKARILDPKNFETHARPGLYIAGREFAGSAKWAPRLVERKWDLVVVDEAHEFLSGLYLRFSRREGHYHEDLRKGKATRAGYLKLVTSRSPVILLTATPLQNSLLELWSLVRYVDRDGITLGALHEFSSNFCTQDGRALKEGTEVELRSRLSNVVCRTLRQDAQPFLKQKFTARHCETINFNMEKAEAELYDAVSSWLDRPMAAFPSRNRRMIALLLRRRMGSSVPALKSTLDRIRLRLEDPTQDPNPERELDEELVEEDLQALMRLDQLARKALSGRSPKLERLLDLIHQIDRKALKGVASDKLVVFTESRRTLQSIIDYLEANGLQGQVTAFSGQNDGPAVSAALKRWEEEVGVHFDATQRPDPSSAVRAALIHEFKTRTRVLVATEAGAKGLNLQFCNCLVNYDLPWNPQRVEQRIGRVHRYGQKHDVVIVNFINQDNEGEARVYELLKEKLQLFEGLFGASDAILGQVVSTLQFERRIEHVFTACRTHEERQQEFDRIALELDVRTRQLHEARLQKAQKVISSLDEDVRARLKLQAEALPLAISRRDESLLALLAGHSPVTGRSQDGERIVFEWRGHRFHLGPPDPSARCGQPLNLDHPLVQEVMVAAREASGDRCIVLTGPVEGTWWAYRVTLTGLEIEDQLLVLGPGGREGLERALAQAKSALQVDGEWEDPPELPDRLEELREAVERLQEPRLQRQLGQLASREKDVRRFLDDRQHELEAKLRESERKERFARDADEKRLAQANVTRLRKELEELRAGRDARLWEAAQAVQELRMDLMQRGFIRAEEMRLFCVDCQVEPNVEGRCQAS